MIITILSFGMWPTVLLVSLLASMMVDTRHILWCSSPVTAPSMITLSSRCVWLCRIHRHIPGRSAGELWSLRCCTGRWLPSMWPWWCHWDWSGIAGCILFSCSCLFLVMSMFRDTRMVTKMFTCSMWHMGLMITVGWGWWMDWKRTGMSYHGVTYTMWHTWLTTSIMIIVSPCNLACLMDIWKWCVPACHRGYKCHWDNCSVHGHVFHTCNIVHPEVQSQSSQHLVH